MNFYIELTDEEIEFIKYVLTLSKDFAKQIFKDKVIFIKTVETSDGRCKYSVEQTSEGPRIYIRITTAKKGSNITFFGQEEFNYQYSSYNPWTYESTCVKILSPEEHTRRRKMEELKKLVLLATHVREIVANGEPRYYSINQVETSKVIDEDKIVVHNKSNLITTVPLSYIIDYPEICGFYTMVPTEAITKEIKDMLE